MPRAQLEPTLSGARFWGSFCVAILFVALFILKGYPFAQEVGGLLNKLMGTIYKVDQINVKGIVRTSPKEVEHVSHLSYGMPLTGVDVAQVKDALEGMPWIYRAKVRRAFPGKIDIEVQEYTPFGVWNVGGKQCLVSRSGVVIQAPPPQDVFLYRLWGQETPKYAPSFMRTLYSFDPTFAKDVQGLHRQTSGRMDVFLKDGLRVCLPREGVGFALSVFRRLRTKVSLHAYQSVDLRVRGRAALTPLPKDAP